MTQHLPAQHQLLRHRPKGTLLKDAGYLFTDNGYKLKSFNTINLDESMHYNPLKYVKTDTDIPLLRELLHYELGNQAVTRSGRTRRKMLYTALIALLRDWFPGEGLQHVLASHAPLPCGSA